MPSPPSLLNATTQLPQLGTGQAAKPNQKAKPSQTAKPNQTGNQRGNQMGASGQMAKATQPRQTQAVATQPAGWQSALPVSPWSTYERQTGPVTGLETETVLRSDLRALKKGRLRAWIYLGAVIVLSGLAGHFALRVLEANATKYRQLEQRYRTLSQISTGDAGSQVAARVARPGQSSATAASGEPSAEASNLADELKRQLVGDTALTIEARGDRVVVAMDDGSLFVRNLTEVGQSGYRVLYRFGKALKNVRDRRVVVTIVSNEGLHNRPWVTAVGRGVALGRFLIDDLSVEANRVTVAAPAPRPRGTGAKSDRIEFSLEPIGDPTPS